MNILGAHFYWAARAANRVRDELRSIIVQRRASLARKTTSPVQDLLSHLLVTTDEYGRFMTEEVVDNILGILIGGQDTTSSVLALIMKYLGAMPDIYNQILRD